VIRGLRNFIFGLRPLLLDSGNLLDGLRALAEEMRRNTAIEVSIRGELPEELPLEVVAELLSIAREALANVARHSGATHAFIDLDMRDENVQLVIEDDGRGIVPGALQVGGHHGLANMRVRAAALGGVFEIDSALPIGTRIIVAIPPYGRQRRESR
jgi:signal transduction histidine kinase